MKEHADIAGGAAGAVLPGLEVSEALRSRSFWLIYAIAEVFFATAGVGLRVHLVPFLTGVGYSPTLAAEILGAMFVFSAIGSFAIGALADRLGGRATLSRIFLAGAVGIAALLGASHLVAGRRLHRDLYGLVRETHVLPIVITGKRSGRSASARCSDSWLCLRPSVLRRDR